MTCQMWKNIQKMGGKWSRNSHVQIALNHTLNWVLTEEGRHNFCYCNAQGISEEEKLKLARNQWLKYVKHKVDRFQDQNNVSELGLDEPEEITHEEVKRLPIVFQEELNYDVDEMKTMSSFKWWSTRNI